MNKQMIDMLTAHFCPDADTAWLWLRAMSDLGYDLVSPSAEGPVFTQPAGTVAPVAAKGAVKWHAGDGVPKRQGLIAKILGRGLTLFDDPVSAARWWAVEVTNNPTPKPSPGMSSGAQSGVSSSGSFVGDTIDKSVAEIFANLNPNRAMVGDTIRVIMKSSGMSQRDKQKAIQAVLNESPNN